MLRQPELAQGGQQGQVLARRLLSAKLSGARSKCIRGKCTLGNVVGNFFGGTDRDGR